MAKEETLNPDVELTAEDAVELEARSEDEFSKETYGYAIPQVSFGGTKSDKATVDAHSDLVVFALEGKTKGTIAYLNKSTATATFRVLGSLDGGKTFEATVFAEAAGSAGTVAAPSATLVNWAATGAAGAAFGVYTHLKVQARSTVGATPATVGVKGVFST